MFLGHPDPVVRCVDPDPDPSVIKKKSKKNLDSDYFVIFFGLLSWKIDVNVLSGSNMQKTVRLEGQ
jgi:hypothetical protein